MKDITNIESNTFTYNTEEFKNILVENMDSIDNLFKVYFSYANKYSKYYSDCMKFKDKKLLSLVIEYHFYKKVKSPYRTEHNIIENIKTLEVKINNRILILKKYNKDTIQKPEKTKKKPHYRVPVAMLDDNGKVLKTFKSITKAFKYLNKTPNGAIKKACDKNKKLLGYHWKRI